MASLGVKTCLYNSRSVSHNLIIYCLTIAGHAATKLCYRAALQECVYSNGTSVRYYTYITSLTIMHDVMSDRP